MNWWDKPKSPGQRNVWTAERLLPLCICAQNQKEPTPPDIHVVNAIAPTFFQPEVRLDRSCCPQDAVLLPASEQTIIQHFLFFLVLTTYPSHPVGWNSPNSPAVKSEDFDVNILAHALLSGMDCNTVSSHFKHGLNTKYILFHWKSGLRQRMHWSKF